MKEKLKCFYFYIDIRLFSFLRMHIINRFEFENQ